MKTYFIEVAETYTRLVEVQAEDSESAVKLVHDMYNEEEIVLDSLDFIRHEITDVTSEIKI